MPSIFSSASYSVLLRTGGPCGCFNSIQVPHMFNDHLKIVFVAYVIVLVLYWCLYVLYHACFYVVIDIIFGTFYMTISGIYSSSMLGHFVLYL